MNDRDDLARASVLIAATPEVVWRALVDPTTVPRLMPVNRVVVPWGHGARFVWRFDLKGKEREVSGTVLRFEPGHVLEYDYADPFAVGSSHRVVIELADEGGGTRVSITQDANRGAAAHAHAEGGWRLALNNLKAIVEGRSPAS
jgi:uncharacterized protein YndB with AHSA1/START domain